MVRSLEPVSRLHVRALAPVDAQQARALVGGVSTASVRDEIDHEGEAREERRAAREHRTRQGRPIHCGGCFWILRSASGPCPRCGYTNGYGYPR